MPRPFRKFTKRSTTNTSVRLTGLFESRRRGLFVGTARPEELKALAKKLKEGYESGRGVTFFLWKNDRNDGPEFSLTADVAQEKVRRRPIEDADEDDDNGADEGDAPESDDSLDL